MRIKLILMKKIKVKNLVVAAVLIILFTCFLNFALLQKKIFSLIQYAPKNSSKIIENKIVTSMYPSPEEELFIVFCTSNYEDLLEILVKSVHKFSTRHILAYGVDYEITLKKDKYPRLLKKTIKQSDCGVNIFTCKPYSIMITNTSYGVYFDVDNVAGHYIDKLFEVLKAWDGPHPLSPVHEKDPRNQDYFMERFKIRAKSQPYVHGHVLWKSNHKKFVKEWWELAQQVDGSNFDETALNLVLWKHNYKHTACKYDPYISFSEYYLKDQDHNDGVPIINIHFHGGKWNVGSGSVYDQLIASKPKRLQTKCCPPFATEYPKHFMICKYNDTSIF